MKKTLRVLLICFVALFLMGVNSVNAEDQEEYIAIDNVFYYGTSEAVQIPKKYVAKEAEMRGAWIATVWNLDFGRQNGTNDSAIETYKKNYITLLDTLESYNINTVFFQIRPCNDAFYKSELNPWSKFLAGAGVDPGWDPLAWMIEQTHARGLRFMCWMNAFRVTEGSILPSGKDAKEFSNEQLLAYKKTALDNLADGNFAKEHPEYTILGSEDCKLILNPGEPAVQEHIINTLKEIAENYDVDGMHFDDYFYLNASTRSDEFNANFAGGDKYNASLTGQNVLNDLPIYEEYKKSPVSFGLKPGLNLGDFRRESLNNMMKNIRTMIDKYNKDNNKNVEYGSKPAAVWQSRSKESTDINEGSSTAMGAYSSYLDLYADTKTWVESGYVDWIAPQVYYDFYSTEAPYADIVKWWAEVVTATNEERAKSNLKPIKMYVAHGIYNYDEAEDRFNNASEIQRQLKFNQMYDCIKGSAVYDYTTLYSPKKTTTKAAMNILKNTWNTPVYNLPRGAYDASNLSVNNPTAFVINDQIRVSFSALANAKGYGVYKVLKGNTPKATDLLAIRYDLQDSNGKVSFDVIYDETYDYYVRAVSKNDHLSDEFVKVSLVERVNHAPNNIEVSINNGLSTAKVLDVINIEFSIPTDDDGDKVTYKVIMNTKINDVRQREITNLTEVDGKIKIQYEALLEAELWVDVIITDGIDTVTCTSDKVVVANEKPNVAPGEVTLNLNGGLQMANTNEDIICYIPYATDENEDELTYDIKISINGLNGPFTITPTDVTYESDRIVVKFKSETNVEEACVQVVISDGELTTTCHSNVISIAEKVLPDVTCVDDPTQEKCQEQEKTCEEDPNQEKCQKSEEPKKGCKKKNQVTLIMGIITSISLLALVLKRK